MNNSDIYIFIYNHINQFDSYKSVAQAEEQAGDLSGDKEPKPLLARMKEHAIETKKVERARERERERARESEIIIPKP